MAITITDLLNQANDIGVFSYVLPFLIIFAIVFAILEKSGILGKDAKGVNAIVAMAIGLMGLLNDFVSTFFATIFPRMGVFLSILIVVLIFLGFFVDASSWAGKWWIGLVIGIVVVFWSWENWNIFFGGNFYGLSGFFLENIATILIVIAIGAIIYFVIGGKSSSSGPFSGGSGGPRPY